MNRILLSGSVSFPDNRCSYTIMASGIHKNVNGNSRPKTLSIDQFKKMDRLAIEQFSLSIEVMMENAGLQLARMIMRNSTPESKILIGVGTGNNGGGGLVAGRRLAGWGYKIYLHIPDSSLKPLPEKQLARTLAAGATLEPLDDPDLFVDAYFGFSQRLPLPDKFRHALSKASAAKSKKISLDLPSGFHKERGTSIFVPDIILTLTAPKQELNLLDPQPEMYIADIGIPRQLYDDFDIPQPEFQELGFVKYSVKNHAYEK